MPRYYDMGNPDYDPRFNYPKGYGIGQGLVGIGQLLRQGIGDYQALGQMDEAKKQAQQEYLMRLQQMLADQQSRQQTQAMRQQEMEFGKLKFGQQLAEFQRQQAQAARQQADTEQERAGVAAVAGGFPEAATLPPGQAGMPRVFEALLKSRGEKQTAAKQALEQQRYEAEQADKRAEREKLANKEALTRSGFGKLASGLPAGLTPEEAAAPGVYGAAMQAEEATARRTKEKTAAEKEQAMQEALAKLLAERGITLPPGASAPVAQIAVTLTGQERAAEERKAERERQAAKEAADQAEKARSRSALGKLVFPEGPPPGLAPEEAALPGVPETALRQQQMAETKKSREEAAAREQARVAREEAKLAGTAAEKAAEKAAVGRGTERLTTAPTTAPAGPVSFETWAAGRGLTVAELQHPEVWTRAHQMWKDSQEKAAKPFAEGITATELSTYIADPSTPPERRKIAEKALAEIRGAELEKAKQTGAIAASTAAKTAEARIPAEVYQRRLKDVDEINQVADQASTIIDQLEDLSKKISIPDATARATGYAQREFGARMQSDPTLTMFGTQVGKLAPLVRAMGQKGSFSDRDIENALKLVPTMHDIDEVRANKIVALRDFFQRAEAAAVKRLEAPTTTPPPPILRDLVPKPAAGPRKPDFRYNPATGELEPVR